MCKQAAVVWSQLSLPSVPPFLLTQLRVFVEASLSVFPLCEVLETGRIYFVVSLWRINGAMGLKSSVQRLTCWLLSTQSVTLERRGRKRLERAKIPNRKTVRKICHCPGRNDECLNQANDGRKFLPVNVTCWEYQLGQITFAGFLGNQKI